MKSRKLFTYLFILFVSISFSSLAQEKSQGPIKVEMKKQNGKWQLYRGGEPYYIKGIGGQKYLDKAIAIGANSIRTWGVGEALGILDTAHARGLSVVFGLWVAVERQGFDYNDSKAVKAQLEYFTEVVKTYKDHPAILLWGIGNENDLFYTDFKVWNAINDIAKMIHEEDPNHPTMTVTAGLDVAEVQLIQERAPHIDIYGINTYSGLIGIDKQMRSYGWDKPYIISEWGPDGHWEVAKTAWNAPIEQTSSEKAITYRRRYREGIARDEEMCIGSYVFLWGQKQETTPTWYGLFLEDGTETEVLDVLHYEWQGSWPDNRTPQVKDMKMNDQDRFSSVYVEPGRNCDFSIDVSDPDNDQLTFKWELLPESTDIKSGGDKESRPEPVEIVMKSNDGNGKITFKAPKKEGPYRLFIYVYDGNDNAATANFPFYIKRQS